jgi:MFS family permease
VSELLPVDSPVQPAASRAGRTVRSLRVPNYRRYFLGSAVSVTGTWMQRVGQDWLVLELTHSGVALGFSTALQFLPVLLGGLYGGTVVDRLDRRRILLATQATSAVLAGMLAVLAGSHLATIPVVYALSFALGVVTVFDTPARQAFLFELVGPSDLMNAQALYSTVNNGGRLIGPAVAGVVIAGAGVAWAFAVNAVSFVAVLGSLLLLDRSQLRPVPSAAREPGQVMEGLRYVWHRPQLRGCIILVGVVGLLGQNFRVVLPLLASQTYSGSASTYGYLTSAVGLGAVIGALGSAAREHATLRLLTMACAAFGVVNLLLVLAPNLTSALAGMVLLGLTNIVFNTLARTLLLTTSDPAMHGRVMSLHALVFLGSTPIGGPLVGAICALAGARSGLLVAGVSAVLVAGVVAGQRRSAPAAGEAR